RVSGAPPALPPLRLQYADYAAWQRRRLAGERLAEELAWWRERLAGCPPLELPTDHPRPRALSGRGARHAFTLEAPLAAALRELARRERTTLFTVLVAGFQALLGRWSRQEDLAVATAVSHRPHRELEGVVGCFLNDLVLRADLSGDPSFRELLGRAHETVVGALAHQELPFERLVEELQPRRDLSRHPLFQAMVVLENAPISEVRLPGLTLRPLPLDAGTARFDLTLSVVDGAAELEATLEHSTELFTPETAARMADHLVRLLAGAAAEPELPLSRLPLAGEEERRRVLHLWNATEREYGGPALLHRLVEEQARRTPHAVAVESGGATLTCSALVRLAARLAHRLRRLGVGPEARVGVLCERSLELPVALLATLQAGGAWVPLDPDDPPERLALVLEDAAPTVLLAQERHAARLQASCPVVLLDRLEEELSGEPDTPPAVEVAPEGLAYVLFTSGSTGRPKGAMNSHRGIANRLLWMQEALALGPDDRVLQKTPISFDVSVWELFWPLVAGARLVLAPPGEHRDPVALARTITEAGITTVHFVPSMLRAFLEQGAEALAACAVLRRTIASGEALPRDLVERWHARVGAPLFNLYGPTEAAVDVSWRRCPPGEEGVVPIGRPVANTRLHVLDEHFEPAPPGVPGELAIGGVQVGRGYLGRPELTAERFVPDPFGPPGARLYRTGDLARWRGDGELEFLGRLDLQLKVRGMRVEAGEVEAALRACPGVREAVVAVREAGPGDGRLVAWIVPEGEPPTAADLRRRLGGRLPAAMVPAAFVPLERLPTTASGKVDRGALPTPPWWDAGEERQHAPPSTPAEELLAGLWGELLGTGRVGVADDFFELGGHSLLAGRLVARLRRARGVELPLRAVFEAPTLGELARRLEEAEGVAEDEIPRVPRGEPLPLSWAQERLWFLDQLDSGSPVHGIPAALRLRGAVDPELLAEALRRVAARHEVLRTRYGIAGGRPYQLVAPAAEAPLAVSDLGHLPPGEREARAAELQAGEAVARFDLVDGRVLRAHLVRLGGAEHLLLVHLHHVAGDGWSLGVLFQDLAACYRALARGEEPRLPALPVQYADFAVWQRRRLEGGDLAPQLEWWRERLAGAPDHLDLPLDHPRPPVQTARGERESLVLAPELAGAVRELGRREGATPFMTMLAAFAVLLARWSGQHDMVVGVPVADRPRPELEGVVGNFLNTLPLRLDLSGDPSFRELLARVREVALGAFARKEVPFEAILEALQLRRDLARTPLFQVFFNVLNFPLPPLELPGAEVEPADTPEPPARFDLTLYTADEGAGTRCDLVYNADLFGRDRMAEALRQLRAVLEQAVADPERPVGALSLVTPEARRMLPDPAAPLDGSWRGPVPAWL
ncbi:MAG TPA: amino acid adenylation domain-containing protein, partial [Longimicrobiaceae bacterium]|nr:amino acid adenylation domain-containing protein [Longimicrobiaceae bacterium]